LQVAVGVSIVGALGFAAFVAASGEPQSTLYITLGELRSRAAESLEIANRPGVLIPEARLDFWQK